MHPERSVAAAAESLLEHTLETFRAAALAELATLEREGC